MDETKKSLTELHATAKATVTDDDKKETLDDLCEHIERYQEEPEAHHQSLREKLAHSMTKFDAGHHELVGQMQEAIYRLDMAGL